jgi:MipA family protein
MRWLADPSKRGSYTNHTMTTDITTSLFKSTALVLFVAGHMTLSHAQDSKPPDSAATKPTRAVSEFGMGLAVISFPAYRGSDQYSTLAVPVPYIDYQGDFIQADREGIRSRLFDSERLDLTISGSGSPPVKSRGVDRRIGMPDLRPSVELGPQLNVLLSDPRDKSYRLNLRLPLRQAISIEGKPQNLGLIFSPNLNWDFVNPFGWTQSNFGIVVGPVFINKKQSQYFYSVDSAYATPARPVYAARGGYAGSQALVSLSKRVGDVWMGAFVRYDHLHGAAFDDSPLVAQRSSVSAGFAVSYIFKRF